MKPPQAPCGRGWVVDPGAHDLLIGRSSADIAQVVTVDVSAGDAPSRRPEATSAHPSEA